MYVPGAVSWFTQNDLPTIQNEGKYSNRRANEGPTTKPKQANALIVTVVGVSSSTESVLDRCVCLR